jgi:hypothetical protein
MRYAGKLLRNRGKGLLSLAFFVFSFFSCATASVKENTTSVKVWNGGRVIFVSPDGSDRNSGLSSKEPLRTINVALELANPGDTVVLMPGKYYQNISTVRSGTKDRPITIVGMPGSVIYGDKRKGGRIIQIRHSYITLMHLTVNGQFRDCEDIDCYHDKLLYVKGSPDRLLKGIRVIASRFENSWGECLRFKFVEDGEIAWNQVSHCGLRDFVFGRGKQNGEGIYIGTAPEQMPRGKLDRTNNLLVHHNSIATYGSECIDVKEGSQSLKIFDNICTMNQARRVGGISVRANNNLIAGNVVFKNKGAGIRLGGDTEEFGIYNEVVGNYLDANTFSALKVMRFPQKKICGNRATDTNPRKFYPKKSKYATEAFRPCTNR